MKATVLVVDDEVRSLETITRILDEDYDIICANSAAEAEELLKEHTVQVILCDQRMPGKTGVEFLSSVRENWPDILRIIISGYTDSENIIKAINQAGIFHYITKPWHPEQLLMVVQNASRMYQLQQQNRLLANELNFSANSLEGKLKKNISRLQQEYQLDNIIRADDSPMNQVLEQLTDIAQYDISVMITGESGTGKELLARALHYNSNRANKPFVIENCGAMHDELLSSELFGHKKGAFTGASQDRVGRLKAADGGTLFLDEIGNLPLHLQAKLLTVLEQRQVTPLGANEAVSFDVRVVSATNLDKSVLKNQEQFRQDLLFRLNTVEIALPPLRQRSDDIEDIAGYYIDLYARKYHKSNLSLGSEALQAIKAYGWPGNIRELRHAIERAVILSQAEQLQAGDFQQEAVPAVPEKGVKSQAASLGGKAEPAGEASPEPFSGAAGEAVEELNLEVIEKNTISQALKKYRYNISHTAKALGLTRAALYRRMEKHGL